MTGFLHLRVAGTISERDRPVCIGVEVGDVAQDLFRICRVLRSRYPEHGFDELLLYHHRAGVQPMLAEAYEALDRDDRAPLLDLLIRCPTLMTWPHVAWVMADMLNRREGALFAEISKECNRRKTASPHSKARAVFDAAQAVRQEYAAKKMSEPSQKEVILTLDPEAAGSNSAEQSIGNKIRSGKKAAHGQPWTIECHDHPETGVYATETPRGEFLERVGPSLFYRKSDE